MARKSKMPRWGIIVLGLLLLAAAVSCVVVANVGRPFRTLPDFPVEEFVQNSQALEGNTYRLNGQVESLILRKEGLGRVISVLVKEGEIPVAAVVPLSVTANLEKGLRIVASVRVGKNGMLVMQEFVKD